MMIYGLHTHFGDSPTVPGWMLPAVRQRRVQAVRCDAQIWDEVQVNDCLAQVQSENLQPVMVIGLDRPEQLTWLPPGTWALLGNEHDPGGIGWQCSAVDYRPKLDRAAATAKDCGIPLWAPELSNLDQNSQDWLNAIKGSGWPEGLHGLSIHRYGSNDNFDTPHRGFSSREAEVKWLKVAAAGLPFIVTENGWGSKRGMTEAQQLDYARQELQFWLDAGCAAHFWFQVKDGPKESEDFGWFRYPDETPKPVADMIPLTVVPNPDPEPGPGDPGEPPPTDGPDEGTDPPVDGPPDPEDPLKGLMKIALKAANGKFVTAENGGDADGILRANRDWPEPYAWEIFGVHFLAGGMIALQSSGGKFWCAEQGGGGILVCNRDRQDIWEMFKPTGPLTQGAKIGLRCFDGIHFVSCEILNADPVLVANRPWLQAWETFEVVIVEQPFVPWPQRTGLVRMDGRAIVDDQGRYRPVVLTFFWGLHGWKFERDRIHQHYAWMRTQPVDEVRLLCEVNWPDRPIDPNWPDYQQLLGELMDATYSYGKRMKLTLIGGSDGRGLGMKVAQLVAPVVNAGRNHMVTEIECVNEWNAGNKIDIPTLMQMGRYLRQHTPNLIGLSRPGSGDDEDDTTKLEDFVRISKQAGVQVQPLHTRRADHDFGWAQVRQSYDFAWIDYLIGDHGEPPGLASSIRVCERPLHQAMLRGIGLMMGSPMYCLHVGQGVKGVADPSHNRPQNMWEVANIEPIIRVVRNVDRLIPYNAENGQPANNNRSYHPMPLNGLESRPGAPNKDAHFWIGKTDYGNVQKNYAVNLPSGLWCLALNGVKAKQHDNEPVMVGTVRNRCRLVAYDPVTCQTVEARDPQGNVITQLNAGQKYYLPGMMDTQAGYFVHGEPF